MRATIRLISCWKSRTLRRPSSFALESSPRAVEMWVSILEDAVWPLVAEPRSPQVAREADAAAAQALRVLTDGIGTPDPTSGNLVNCFF